MSACEGYPRLSRLVQRPSQEADWTETYAIEGLAQVYRTPHEVLAALMANP